MIYDIGCEFCGNQKAKLTEQDCPELWLLCSKCSIRYWEEGEDAPTEEEITREWIRRQELKKYVKGQKTGYWYEVTPKDRDYNFGLYTWEVKEKKPIFIRKREPSRSERDQASFNNNFKGDKKMGLDHCLTGKQYISQYDYEKKEVALQETLSGVLSEWNGKNGNNNPPFKVQYIEYTILTWRKANQIHSWFVENVQKGNDDCGEYYVEKEQLRELLGLCKTVIENKDNPEKIETLLPPKAGFFFGSQEIDEYYFQDIEETAEVLERVVNGNFDHLSFHYSSSW